MFVKQISVFLENRQGRMEDFTRVLGENGIDLIAISIADTSDFGIVRTIVNDGEKAAGVLKANGYTVKVTDVLAVGIADEPGGLAKALAALGKGDVSIEYLYTLMRRVGDKAVIIFRVDKPETAAGLLNEAGVSLLSPEELAGC